MFKELFKGFFQGSIFRDLIESGENSFTFVSCGREFMNSSLNNSDFLNWNEIFSKLKEK